MGVEVIRDDTKKLAERLDELKKLAVYVGYQGADGAAIHPDSAIPVAQLAAVHEWGSDDDGIPARSFIRRTMLEKRDAIGDELKRAVSACIEGKTTPVQAYARVGKFVVKLVRNKLEDASSWAQPLDVVTAEAKGHTRVLSDTKTLSRNLSYAVRKGRTVLAEGK